MDGLPTTPIVFETLITYGYLVAGPHEDDYRRVGSAALVVCRHCGQIKPPLGWSTQCWRWVSSLQGIG